MTIKYHSNISSGVLKGFAPLLFRWKGSVYKLVYRELLIFIFAYLVIRIVYRYGLNAEQRINFELLAKYCANYMDFIPLSFVLGFYIAIVVQRWWTQFVNIPGPDRLLNTIGMYVEGTDERSHLIRRNLIRYWNLLFLLYMQNISSSVKKRFPSLQDVVKAGYMTEEEFGIYKSVNITASKIWVPMIWFIDLLNKARTEGMVKSDVAIKHMIQELNDTRSKLGLLWSYDWVSLPLVYTQVVTWAVYLFFIAALFGRQFLDPAKKYKGHEIDLYVPIFTVIQFVFYMGWLKVAESLFNAFGNDDDDIELNWIIDRHLMMASAVIYRFIRMCNLSILLQICHHVSYLWIDELQFRCPTSLSPYQPGTNESPDSVMSSSTQEGPSSKKLTPLFGKSEEKSIPRMVGNSDALLTEDALAKLNYGTWRFSEGQMGGIKQRSSKLSAKEYFSRP